MNAPPPDVRLRLTFVGQAAHKERPFRRPSPQIRDRSVRLSASIFLFLLALASSAAAQDTPVRLAQLHDALHLSAEQEEGWRGYVAAIGPDPEADDRRRATEALLPGLTTPRRIALIGAAMALDLADARRRGEAVKAFYERLSPDQQKTFDRQTIPSTASRADSAGANGEGAAGGSSRPAPPPVSP
jgi:hypothetical protein